MRIKRHVSEVVTTMKESRTVFTTCIVFALYTMIQHQQQYFIDFYTVFTLMACPQKWCHFLSYFCSQYIRSGDTITLSLSIQTLVNMGGNTGAPQAFKKMGVLLANINLILFYFK
jgi:hypothetical protein